MTQSVKWFSSSMVGAPGKINGAANKVIDMLDGCLVNGFNVQAVASITVLDGVATVTTTGTHGYLQWSVVQISGVTAPTALNGDWQLQTVGTNTATFLVDGVANGTATGTISMKQAPLGWEKAFSGTNKAAYRPAVGTRCYLRVSDPAGGVTRVRGYNAMSGVDGGSGEFPLMTQQSGEGLVWPKKYQGFTTSSADWYVVGNEKFFYTFWDPQAGESLGTAVFASAAFGDTVTYNPSVPICHIWGTETSLADVTIAQLASAWFSTATGCTRPGGTDALSAAGPMAGRGDGTDGVFSSASYAGVLGGYKTRLVGHAASRGWGTSPTNWGPRVAYPNPADASTLLHHPVHVQQPEVLALVGHLPGAYQPLNTGASSASGSQVVLPSGRRILMLQCMSDDAATRYGCMGLDITGPWE